MPSKFKKFQFMDFQILIPYIILSVVGLMMVYSTTSYKLLEENKNPARQAILQFAFWIVSLLAITFLYRAKNSVLKKEKFISYTFGTIAALMWFVFFFPRVNGSYGWIQLGPIGTLQPAEFLKIGIIWYLASRITARQINLLEFKDKKLSLIAGICGVPLPIAILPMIGYPDFGNFILVFMIAVVVFLASGINLKYTGFVVGIGAVIATVALIMVPKGFGPAHVVSRFKVFKNPFIDEFGAGHQAVHGYYAMFNGGLFGRGLGNSIQKKGFLSEAHTDYAFAITVEELGLIVAILLIGLVLFLAARIILIGIRSKDTFNSLMCIGIGALFSLSLFVNLGGVMGLIPLTGITFPFISQGGSSLLMFSICVGFALNISADEKKKKVLKNS